MDNYIDELKKIGFTGDPDVDEILYTRASINKRNQYDRIMQGVETPKDSGYSHIEGEFENEQKQAEYDARMQALKAQRDSYKGIVRQGFELKHPELTIWERKQASIKPPVEPQPMSDEEIIEMAKRRA